MTTKFDVEELLNQYGFDVDYDQSTIGLIETKNGFTIEYTKDGKFRFYPNTTFIHEIIGKWMSEWIDQAELVGYLDQIARSVKRQRKENYVPNFNEFYNEGHYDSEKQEYIEDPTQYWNAVIDSAERVLNSHPDFKGFQYIGKRPPVRKYDGVNKVFLEFGRSHKDKMIVMASRENVNSSWKFAIGKHEKTR